MNQVKPLVIVIIFVLMLASTFACGKQEPTESSGTEGKAMQGQAGAVSQDKSNKDTKDKNDADKVKQGDNKYVSKKYGFSLSYNQLMFADKIDGGRFAEWTPLSGDKAVVHIKKAAPLVGDDPEARLLNSYKTSPYQIHRRKELKLGKFLPGRWNSAGRYWASPYAPLTLPPIKMVISTA